MGENVSIAKFSTICQEVVNGFHDSILTRIDVNIEAKTVSFHLKVDVSAGIHPPKNKEGVFLFQQVKNFSVEDISSLFRELNHSKSLPFNQILSFDLIGSQDGSVDFKIFGSWESFIMVKCGDFSFQWE